MTQRSNFLEELAAHLRHLPAEEVRERFVAFGEGDTALESRYSVSREEYRVILRAVYVENQEKEAKEA